mmetsp:Transcript_21658/g.30571  ORF Transcript_21658/g.30571 Transcript_21658/m.30571 type:complete len:255 (+) Transcript_21658:76-840(+)
MSDEEDIAIVRCGTSTGPIVLQLHRKWSPNGYDRAVELFRRGFYDNTHFFRVVPEFLVQFGITYSTNKKLKKFANNPIPDDPSLGIKFHEGTISYAGGGDNSRTSQLFISYGDAASLGTQKWETPIGEVVEGMENVRKFYSYGDMPPWGKGPVQGKIYSGRSYIDDNFPKSDYFLKCTIETPGSAKEVDDQPIEKPVVEEVAKPVKIRAAKSVNSMMKNEESGYNTMYIAAVVFFFIAIVALILPRKKESSKRN